MISGTDEDALDAALSRLAPLGPDLANGMTNHAPMVVEALSVMGRVGAAGPWIDRNLGQFTPWPAHLSPVSAGDWREALGRHDRASDWRAAFGAELAREDWRAVLDRWCARLAPGAVAAATHGLIRVGHAARSLARRRNEVRLGELSAALALWASTYGELPASAATSAAATTPAAALAQVAFLPIEQRRNAGSITAALRQLREEAAFADAINLLAPADDIDGAVRDLVELFAEVLLANAHTPLGAVVFTHGVTVFGAVGDIAPSVSHATAAALLRHAWHAAAGLYAAYGTAAPDANAPLEAASVAETIARAVANGDDHAIKLAQACVTWRRADSHAPLAAAARAAMLL